jgi:hypothetical protein
MAISELISELEANKYVSLLLDGSTDKEGVVRFIKDNRVEEVFYQLHHYKMQLKMGTTKLLKNNLENMGFWTGCLPVT